MIDGQRVAALLLSGGGGTRLWPVSTNARPKQFLRLFGERSLFQRTVARLTAADIDELLVVTNVDHEPHVREQTAEIGSPDATVVLEPMRRDSAPAIAAGVAALLAQSPPETVVTVLPCDHLIPDEAHFARDLAQAVKLAQGGFLATFGIEPTSPSTEYGYIQRGEPIRDHAGAFHVAKFHEKPKADLAARYVADRGYDWNSGMFVFRADVFRAEAERHMPEVWRAAAAAAERGAGSGKRVLLEPRAFGAAPKISIDYALFEKSERVGVVPVSFDWSDVGNWDSVHGALPKDGANNAAIGRATLSDASGNLVIGEDTEVIVLGVSDLVVIASPHGTFVAPRSRAAEVKALVERKQMQGG